MNQIAVPYLALERKLGHLLSAEVLTCRAVTGIPGFPLCGG